jgi:hypothetical protein
MMFTISLEDTHMVITYPETDASLSHIYNQLIISLPFGFIGIIVDMSIFFHTSTS